ncbi:Phosphate ABC transporter, periplasmic phosphate-binding protein PstS [Leptospirillum ferriphilum]|uniref:Phosphate-binding protein n=1 Tax=Leptospirillum ferriphilum TaxID=178606 RepID=A0A094WFZ9_9BACT|nr:phosphate ABC transporter substrate-binding protein PstS [Leptospirillum ferriphilum]KGA94567.1 Phosphate ABC transporter, periplasmic phosphate-binding protein PstS [Leptospirillum ferriphilum]
MGSMTRLDGGFSGRRILMAAFLFCNLLIVGAFRPTGSQAASNITISGSTMLFPLEQVWALAYMKQHPGVHISVASTGSGFGIANAANGNITVGASDAYLTKEFRQRYTNLVSVPIAFDDAQVIYNIPGLDKKTVLNFDGKVLARIYLGKIRFWNDRQIRALNPSVHLPHTRIRVVHRADASGTTFVFTDYLNQTSREWYNQVGRDMSPAWPVGSGYNGSDAVVAAVMSSPGSIGYVGLGWVMEYHLTTGALKNLDGEFVRGSVDTIRAAGHAALKDPSFPDDFNRSIVWNIHGKNVYPDANFEFWMINTNLDAGTMKDVRNLLMWALTKGQAPKYTVKSGFAPLPFRPLKPRLDKIINRLLPGNGFNERSPG